MKNIHNKLLNAVLPLFLFEWWYILVAFVFVIFVSNQTYFRTAAIFLL